MKTTCTPFWCIPLIDWFFMVSKTGYWIAVSGMDGIFFDVCISLFRVPKCRLKIISRIWEPLSNGTYFIIWLVPVAEENEDDVNHPEVGHLKLLLGDQYLASFKLVTMHRGGYRLMKINCKFYKSKYRGGGLCGRAFNSQILAWSGGVFNMFCFFSFPEV